MAGVTIKYKNASIATMSASGTKTLLTEGKYCEDDIEVVYVSPGGGGSTLGTKSINANGTYNASSDSLDGYSQVTVSVPASAVDTGTKSISTNGTHDVIGYASASVSVPTGTARSSSDLTASNLTVTAPAGLYAEAASKTLSDANLTAGNIKKDVTIFAVTGTYEGSGGGSSVLYGTFTPGEDTNSVTISALAGTTLNHFLLKPVGKISNGAVTDTRTWFLAYQDFSSANSNYVRMASNSAGGTGACYYGWGDGLAASATNSRFSFDRTTGVFSVSNTTTNGGGILAAGITYEYHMW